MASTEKILFALGILQELFPLWNQTEMTERVWTAGLRDIPDDVLVEAVNHFVENYTTTSSAKQPAPGDIRKIAYTLHATTWEQAWDEICAKAYASLHPLFSMGRFLEVEWSSPDVPLLMNRMGGADVFISQSKEQMGTNRAQFRQMFENHVAQAGPIIPPNSPLLAAKQEKQLGAKQPFRQLEIEGYDV